MHGAENGDRSYTGHPGNESFPVCRVRQLQVGGAESPRKNLPARQVLPGGFRLLLPGAFPDPHRGESSSRNLVFLFTFHKFCARIIKHSVKGSFHYSRIAQQLCFCSSVDRAMPSGGMCGGSTPPRRVFFMPWKKYRIKICILAPGINRKLGIHFQAYYFI